MENTQITLNYEAFSVAQLTALAQAGNVQASNEMAKRKNEKEQAKKDKESAKALEAAKIISGHRAQGFDYLYDEKNRISNRVENYIEFISKSPKYTSLRFNEFSQQPELNNRAFSDRDMSAIAVDMSCEFGYSVGDVNLHRAFDVIMSRRSFNPVAEYLHGLKWDGVQRAEKIFIEWLGASDTYAVRMMTTKWLLSAVKRILEAGCEAHSMIILAGGQGIGKSTMCKRLAKNYFAERIDIDKPTSTVPVLDASWIVAFDEMEGMNRKDINSLKTFLTQNADRTTLKYDKYATCHPRHCVFIGSTNEETFLRDYTAEHERRFWVIDCLGRDGIKVHEQFTDEVVDQIWAEVMTMYRNGDAKNLTLDTRAIEELIEIQAEHKTTKDDDVFDVVMEIVNHRYTLDERGYISREQFIAQASGRERVGQGGKLMDYIPQSYLLQAIEVISKRKVSIRYILSSKDVQKVIEKNEAKKKFGANSTRVLIIKHEEEANEQPAPVDEPAPVEPNLNTNLDELFKM